MENFNHKFFFVTKYFFVVLARKSSLTFCLNRKSRNYLTPLIKCINVYISLKSLQLILEEDFDFCNNNNLCMYTLRRLILHGFHDSLKNPWKFVMHVKIWWKSLLKIVLVWDMQFKSLIKEIWPILFVDSAILQCFHCFPSWTY